MADQEFLASFAVDIDEGGVSRLQSVLEENRDLANEVAAAFSAATAAIEQFVSELPERLPDLFPGMGNGSTAEGLFGLSGGIPVSLELDTAAAEESLGAFREMASEPVRVSLDASESFGEGNDSSGKLNMDLTEARAKLEAFRKEASKPVSMSGNASGIVSAARTAWNSIQALFATPITIRARVEQEGAGGGNGSGTGGGVKMSSGGRFTKPTDVQVAEDGDAEYIIPVKKEDRAVPLLRQLLAELSPSARASLSVEDGASSLVSGGLAAGTATAAQITQNNSNVSAPVTIQVRSTGADATQVGQKLYDTTERYLLRTLKGVFS